MSTIYKKPLYTPRQQENTWMNMIYTSHDQFCGCDEPLIHFMQLINRDSPCIKPLKDIKNIKCLLTGADDADTKPTEEENPGFFDGELEKLFAEETIENGDADTR